MSTDIVVSENVSGEAMEALRATHQVHHDASLWNHPGELAEKLSEARALIVRNQTKVTREIIASAPQLQVIGRAGAGLDNIDTEAASEAGIVVSYAPSDNSISVAELVMGFLLTAVRQIPAAWQDTRRGGWNRMQFVGGELFGRTLGIVGLGRIGRLVAERANCFGMELVAHDDFIAPDAPVVNELRVNLASLDELLNRSDFITVHVPLTDQTRNLFSYDRFAQMKSSSWFLNASRGEVVNEEGLLRALHEGCLAGAALDVRSTEPPTDTRLAQLDNVILTPHIGAFTHEAQERVVATVCSDVESVLAGGEARSAFNFSRPRR